MRFGPGRRLRFLAEPLDDTLRHRLVAAFIPLENRGERRLQIHQLDTRTVICEKIDPSPSSLKNRVGRIEGKVRFARRCTRQRSRAA